MEANLAEFVPLHLHSAQSRVTDEDAAVLAIDVVGSAHFDFLPVAHHDVSPARTSAFDRSDIVEPQRPTAPTVAAIQLIDAEDLVAIPRDPSLELVTATRRQRAMKPGAERRFDPGGSGKKFDDVDVLPLELGLVTVLFFNHDVQVLTQVRGPTPQLLLFTGLQHQESMVVVEHLDLADMPKPNHRAGRTRPSRVGIHPYPNSQNPNFTHALIPLSRQTLRLAHEPARQPLRGVDMIGPVPLVVVPPDEP